MSRQVRLPGPKPDRPTPRTARVLLQTRLQMEAHLSHRVEGEYIEKAARMLLEGKSGQEADPIVVDAVATIMQRIADHACALEFGANGAQRVAAAEALGKVQALLAKLAEPRRAEFVELVADHARRLHGLPAERDAEDELAIAKAFIVSATRFDRAFRRLGDDHVRSELSRLTRARTTRAADAMKPAAVAGGLSAKVGAFNDRSPKTATASFEKAWKNRLGAERKSRSR